MEPIVKPELVKLAQNIIYSLKNGMKTIYDVLVDVQKVVDDQTDWLNTNGAIMKDNEDERIKAEKERAKEFATWRGEIESHDFITEEEREKLDSIPTSASLEEESTWVDSARMSFNNEDGEYYGVEIPVCSQDEGDYTGGLIPSSEYKRIYESIRPATTGYNGLMSKEDKMKLNSLNNYSKATISTDGLMSKEDKKLVCDYNLLARTCGVSFRVIGNITTTIGQFHVFNGEKVYVECLNTNDAETEMNVGVDGEETYEGNAYQKNDIFPIRTTNVTGNPYSEKITIKAYWYNGDMQDGTFLLYIR